MTTTVEGFGSDHAPPAPSEVRAQLERVLASRGFTRAPRMRRFLSFLVEETLAGRRGQLKEYTIATEVFGKPAGFAPGESAVVRVEAGRLRRLLAQYALEAGPEDLLQIDVPKGSYVPAFHRLPKTADAVPVRDDAGVTGAGQTWPNREQRLVTALSCGFGRAAGVAPVEGDLLDVLDELHSRCAEVGRRHGGEIDAGAGDRLMVYFGWPLALEDGAGRALSAALEMSREVEAAAGDDSVTCRLGVATSTVITRDPVLAGATHRAAVIGEAPALATQLQLRAPAGATLVAESTRRRTGAAFHFLPAGEVEAGAGGGLAWRLLTARANTTRFQALHSGLRSAMVGRSEERALLMSRWRLAQGGEGQAVMLLGEAGMGKSRLAESILEDIGAEGVRLRAQCSPTHANSMLFPILQLLRTRMGLGRRNDNVASAAAKILQRTGPAGELDHALLTGLLSGDDAGPDGLSASARKGQTLKLLRRILLALGRARPIILLVEDVHWADPTTLEFLQELIEAAASARLLVIMTSRPDNAPSFPMQTNVTAMRLSRLPRADCNALLDSMSDAARLSASARGLILDRAEGVPLYLEELAKLMLAAEVTDLRQPAVPDSLADLLATQLDRLGPSRAVAQMAAAIGRVFPRAMLAQIAGGAAGDLEPALDQLIAAGILVRDRRDGVDTLAFRHALLGDAAYRSLPEPTRRELHGRIADTLLDSMPEVAADQPELVAHHLMEAGRPEESVAFWIDAGDRAASRYALTEGIAHLRMARRALASLKGEDTRERELSLLIQLALLIRSARGYGDLELLSIYQRAEALARELGRPARRLEVTYGFWTQAAGLGHWPRAREYAKSFGQQAASLGRDDQLTIETLRLTGACDVFSGDFERARERHLAAFELYDPQRHGPRFGFDPGAVVAAYLSWTHWLLDEPEEARTFAARALAIAEAQNHPPTLGMVLCWVIFHAMCDEDMEAIERLNARLQALCEQRECRYWQPFGAACAEWAAFSRDRLPRRLERLLEHTDAFEEHYLKSCLLLGGAQMCIVLGRPEQGLQLVDRAMAFIADHEERIWEAEAARVQAELLLLRPDADLGRAEALLRQAAELARAQKAVALERRAEASLRRLTRRDVAAVGADRIRRAART